LPVTRAGSQNGWKWPHRVSMTRPSDRRFVVAMPVNSGPICALLPLLQVRKVSLGEDSSALLLPTAAQSLIELHESLHLVVLRLGKAQFIGKVVRLVGEHFQVVGRSGLETLF